MVRSTLCLLVALAGLPGRSADAQTDFHELIEEALEHFQSGDFLESARAMEAAIELDPTEVTLVYHIGRAYQEYGRCVTALDYFERFDAEADADHRARVWAAVYLPEIRDCANAYQDLVINGLAAFENGDTAAASTALGAAIALSNEPVARVMLLRIYVHAGDCDLAAETLDAVVDDPDLEPKHEAQLAALRDALSDCGREN